LDDIPQALSQPNDQDGEQEASTGRPKYNPNPSAALLNNSEQVTLPSQKQALKDFRMAEAARRPAGLKPAVEAEALATPCPISPRAKVRPLTRGITSFTWFEK
jgi:hypothetical protein